ncbi:MAG: beta-galactosidase [Actinomycetes bacterium]
MTPSPLTGLRFGAAYYAEYQPSPRLDADLELMSAARFTVIRVGESVWSTWEPEDGRFELDWLQPVLDGALARGIGVILGTPTYACPPWLATAHPEIAAEVRTGQRMGWGSRQEIDITHPTFRRYAERIVRTVVARYANHPAVIGFQVDNEPGALLLHNEGTFASFVQDLMSTYGDVETLNRAWGLTYWSHRLADWSELWRPDGNAQPQYDLAWRRFQAAEVARYIAWQADIVREYARADQFVTTCIAFDRPAMDEHQTARTLDVTASNAYFGVQDHLDVAVELPAPDHWVRTGVAGLLELADRSWAIRQERFLVTETNCASIHLGWQNLPPYPGQLQQAALALVARGAAMVEYWHWHSLHWGTETYWGGVLPHSQVPGRIYREVSAIGAVLARLGTHLDDYVPDADVTLLWSTASKYAFEGHSPLAHPDGSPRATAYADIVAAFQRGVVDAGAQVRYLHSEQLAEATADELAAAHRVLIAAGFYTATDADLRLLRDYAHAGGHLVIGVRTGYGDQEARARIAVAPDVLHDAAGVWYEEFSNLRGPVAVEGALAGPDAAASDWVDGLIVEGADVLATYRHPRFSAFPAVTTRSYGRGRITCVGTVPNRALAADLVRHLVPDPVGGPWQRDRSVTVLSGVAHGRRTWFLHNWSATPARATAPHDVVDLIDDAPLPAGHEFVLEAWGCRVLADAPPDPSHVPG